MLQYKKRKKEEIEMPKNIEAPTVYSKMELPVGVCEILSRFDKAGAEAYVVGGAVRNHLLGKKIDDYDITTALTPDRVMELFGDLRVITTGLKHGTVTVLLDNVGYEITTYRIEGEYLDNRHPSEVKFTSMLSGDLSRRDFTVNAMCYHPVRGFVDLFGGIEDINKGIIRAVGDARVRFTEDALRIIRALRFASVLDFDIEEKTKEAIGELYPLLANISVERIATELKKLMVGKGAYRIIGEFRDVFTFILPELDRITLPASENFEASTDGFVRFLSLFALGSSRPEEAYQTAARRLKLDRATINRGTQALEVEGLALDSKPAISEAFYKYGTEPVITDIHLRTLLGKEANYSLALEVKNNGIYSIKSMDIRGEDLIALGIKGVLVGQMLEKALFAIMRGEINNKKSEILDFVKGEI